MHTKSILLNVSNIENMPHLMCTALAPAQCANNRCNCTSQKVLQGWDLVNSPASDETTH